MIWLAATPFVVAILLACFADPLSRQLRPSVAVRWLTGLSLSVSLCTGLVLSVAAVLVCVQVGPLPSIGGWSVRTLRTGMGFPMAAGLVALVVVAWFLGAAIRRTVLALLVLARANRSVNQLEPAVGNLVLIDDVVPTAYSVAGRPGRIVISRSMLAALSAAERRVLIAHEGSHLRHRHDLYLHVAEVATAANPLLRPAARSIGRAVERWADEDAAAAVGDRELTACALARAALATAGRPAARPALAIADGGVAERVTLLLRPAPDRRLLPVLLVAGASLTSWVAALAVTAWADNLVQVAEAVYQRH